MKAFRNSFLVLAAFLLMALTPFTSLAGVPEVSHVMVTDVTTVSFSVIWASSEAATADLEVYEDEAFKTPEGGFPTTPHPLDGNSDACDACLDGNSDACDDCIKELAENNGVMKVRVTGLAADTTYYFRTVTTAKATPDTTIFPAAPETMSATTEVQTVRSFESGDDVLPFSNDVIIEQCHLSDGTTPAEGTLLVATVAGGNYPVTAFVGDCVACPNALIDLNNFFNRETHKNLDLIEGENLTLLNFRGMAGNAVATYEIPLDQSLCEIAQCECFLKTGWNFISTQLFPDDTDLQTVLSPIWDKVTSVWTFYTTSDHWYRYDKNNPFPWLNDLTTFEFGRGYWLLMSESASLKVNGRLPSDDDVIPLYEGLNSDTGWNSVGYKSIETLFLDETIDGIDPVLVSIWTYNNTGDHWERYDKNNPFPWLNDLQNIMPGKAYWVEVTENTSW